MSSENHLELPEEVFEMILLNLDVDALLSSAQVCVGWRNAVNNNRVWENLCKHKMGASRLKSDVALRKAYEFGKIEERVEDGVDSFTQICSWRVRYMHDVDLKRNWRSGVQLEEIIGYVEVNLYDFETDYQVLLEPCMSMPTFNVYQMTPTPILSETLHFCLQHPIPEFFKMIDNVMVVVQCTLLQAYTLNDGVLSKSLVALFDKDHVHAKSIPRYQDLSNWYSEMVGLYPCDIYVRCDHNGRFFVGMYNQETDYNLCYLHIWDLKEFTKINRVPLPNIPINERLLDVSFSLQKNILRVMLKSLSAEFGTPYNSVHSYDIERMEYSQTIFKVDYVIPVILFTEKYMISTNFPCNKLFLNDFHHSQCLRTLDKSKRLDVRSLQICDQFLAYAVHDRMTGYGYTVHVHVYDTTKGAQIDEFTVPRTKTTYNMHIFFENLMLIGTNMLVYLRDIKVGSIIRTFECVNFIPPDPACTKMIIEKLDGELVLLNFW